MPKRIKPVAAKPPKPLDNRTVRNRCLEGLAVNYGTEWEEVRGGLLRSIHATIAYGRGGQEGHDRTDYQRRHGYRSTRWLNGGVEWEVADDGEVVLRLENYRGTVVARVSLYRVVDWAVRQQWRECPAVSDGVSVCVLLDWLDECEAVDTWGDSASLYGAVVRRWCGLSRGRPTKPVRHGADQIAKGWRTK